MPRRYNLRTRTRDVKWIEDDTLKTKEEVESEEDDEEYIPPVDEEEESEEDQDNQEKRGGGGSKAETKMEGTIEIYAIPKKIKKSPHHRVSVYVYLLVSSCSSLPAASYLCVCARLCDVRVQVVMLVRLWLWLWL